MLKNFQIARSIFLVNLETMKKILDLGKYKLGSNSEDFIYYKQQIMEYTYNNLKKLFKQLEAEKIIKKCPNKCNLKQGYKNCVCGGSGYINMSS